MALREVDLSEETQSNQSKSSTGGKRYPKKSREKPDPETFSHERTAGHAVGPELEEIGGIEKLVNRMEAAETVEDWSFILGDYIKWGNNSKVSKYVGVFSMNAAHDCPNRWTDNCQVDGDECYSVEDEEMYDYVLDYYRRQEYLWDCMDADTWAAAFKKILSRKRNPVRAVKFNQAGDFRHDGDVIKVNRIAEELSELGIPVYTYSASDYLDWSNATSDNLTINQSNSFQVYGDRRYMTVADPEDIPEDSVWCPYDRSKTHPGGDKENKKCGECMLCITGDAPDITVTK